MNLRRLLDRLSSVSGLTSEEKDPEEFLNSLLAQILKAEPFLKLNSGQESFYYQLFVEKDADLTLPTVQQLFEQSFLTSNIKLKEVPSCLIIQMPRFGKNYKMYPRILPSQLLDVTDVIEGSPRQCIVCGKLARWECKECFDDCSNAGLESTAFCSKCLETAHRHERRSHHRPVRLEVSDDFSILEDHCRPPRLFMELFAVICIETSHYVAFVKCGVGHEAPWCFFDSMADRKGSRPQATTSGTISLRFFQVKRTDTIFPRWWRVPTSRGGFRTNGSVGSCTRSSPTTGTYLNMLVDCCATLTFACTKALTS
jgi:ubiquitin thioesterase CYLD